MSYTSKARRSLCSLAAAAVLAGAIVVAASPEVAESQTLQPIVPYLQERLGLNEQQVRGALGALLIFSREHLPKPQFDQLARRMPNAEQLMADARLRGIVTAPIDDVTELEGALGNIGIAEQVAAQFGPAVLDYLGSAGYYEERDVLSRTMN